MDGVPADPLLRARALVLHDLAARSCDRPEWVDLVEDVVTERRWWVEHWPEGAAYVAGQIAQDVQDRLLDAGRRWPLCAKDDGGDEQAHELHIEPDLGPDPHWVCDTHQVRVAPLGALPAPE